MIPDDSLRCKAKPWGGNSGKMKDNIDDIKC